MKERKNWQKQKEVCLYVLGVVCLLYFVLSVVVFLFWRDTYLAHPNLFLGGWGFCAAGVRFRCCAYLAGRRNFACCSWWS